MTITAATLLHHEDHEDLEDHKSESPALRMD